MSTLAISNVINVSVSTPPTGVSAYQNNNLAIFTKEVPVNGAITFAAPGIYVSLADVGTDWGTGSEVYSQASLIFSQQPNILSGDGKLIVFPIQSGDILAGVIPIALPIQFFGGALYAGYAPVDAELIAAAPVAQSQRVLLYVSQYLTTAVAGVFTTIHNLSTSQVRKLLYTQAGTALGARLMAAAYAGRGQSVDFSGNDTTSNMHLKQLAGIEADLGITQSLLTACQTAGVDVYPSIGGRASVFCSGGDDFFDNVYNLNWLVFALTVAGFNALAETGTKIPQTEPGIAILRNAYTNVLKQGVANGFLAPGAWNSPELFGDPAALIRNIAQLGFYIYSQPVNQQPQVDRAARKAPLIQIAVKYAGAVDSSSVVVFVNP